MRTRNLTLLTAFAGLLVASCSDSVTPVLQDPTLTIVRGTTAADTIQTRLLQALVVELRDSTGAPLRNATVRFESPPSADSARAKETTVSVCLLASVTCDATNATLNLKTGADGRASALIRLGTVAGAAVVRVSAPDFGLRDSVTYSVQPGAAVRVLSASADTTIYIGANVNLAARTLDRFGNSRGELPQLTSSTPDALSVDAGTNIVTGRDLGVQWVYARLGTFVDSMRVRVVPSARLVAYAPVPDAARMLNTDGSAVRTLATGVKTEEGIVPRFGVSRQRVLMMRGNLFYPTTLSVVDTTTLTRRDVVFPSGAVHAIRELPDGNILIVAQRSYISNDPGNAVFRIGTDHSVTELRRTPELPSHTVLSVGIADISHDGTRVAYTFGTALRILVIATGEVVTVATGVRTPRWSEHDDQIAFQEIGQPSASAASGSVGVMNANGTGRRSVTSVAYHPVVAWSPDSKYMVGSTANDGTLQIIRVSDGKSVPLRSHPAASGSVTERYVQPDWR